MGFLDWFINKKHHQNEPEALRSARNSARIRVAALETALESAPQPSVTYPRQISQTSNNSQFQFLEKPKMPSESTEIQRESYHLGLAAGYTGKSLREIENSLQRIETMMVTKDWFLNQFPDYTSELVTVFKEHENNEQRRFEAIIESINRISNVAKAAPEPIRSELMAEITSLEQKLPLTPKMEQLLGIVKESKQVSYEELASKLGIELSALRGLLTLMSKRTNEIERFKVNGQGWVRYKALRSARIN